MRRDKYFSRRATLCQELNWKTGVSLALSRMRGAAWVYLHCVHPDRKSRQSPRRHYQATGRETTATSVMATVATGAVKGECSDGRISRVYVRSSPRPERAGALLTMRRQTLSGASPPPTYDPQVIPPTPSSM
jgi:hypothetical protein